PSSTPSGPTSTPCRPTAAGHPICSPPTPTRRRCCRRAERSGPARPAGAAARLAEDDGRAPDRQQPATAGQRDVVVDPRSRQGGDGRAAGGRQGRGRGDAEGPAVGAEGTGPVGRGLPGG